MRVWNCCHETNKVVKIPLCTTEGVDQYGPTSVQVDRNTEHWFSNVRFLRAWKRRINCKMVTENAALWIGCLSLHGRMNAELAYGWRKIHVFTFLSSYSFFFHWSELILYINYLGFYYFNIFYFLILLCTLSSVLIIYYWLVPGFTSTRISFSVLASCIVSSALSNDDSIDISVLQFEVRRFKSQSLTLL